MKTIVPFMLIKPGYSKCKKLLVFMTNEFIEQRNSYFDSARIQGTNKIPDVEDVEYLQDMDKSIKMVRKFLK